MNFGVLSQLLLVALVRQAAGALVGAAVLPHGDFAFDPSLLQGLADSKDYDQANALHHGSLQAASFVTGLQPDVIVLTTPHGLETSWDLVFYGNSYLKGSAVVGGDLIESFAAKHHGATGFAQYDVSLNVRGASTLSGVLLDAAIKTGSNATLLKSWQDVLPQELHWGEVLPLELIRRAAGARGLPPVAVVGLPLARYNFTSAVAGGVRKMGQALGRALARDITQRVAFVVSTDLSHRHWSNTSFGFSPEAQPFDDSIGRWASSLDTGALLDSKMLARADHIYSCGYLGLVLLHGVLEGAGEMVSSKLTAAPAAPTYYGMMAATFALGVGDDQAMPAASSLLSSQTVFN